MPRSLWPLLRGKPQIEIILTQAIGKQQIPRILLADTGAGSAQAMFEMIMDENDCLVHGGNPITTVPLRGAFSGTFPLYNLRVRIPQLGFDDRLRVVGVATVPPHFDGIAGFRFLTRFTYGNFGFPDQFGLEL